MSREQFFSTSKTEEWIESPASQKRESVEENVQKTIVVDRSERVKKKKFELELIKYIDCFLECYGSYISELMTFKTKSL